MSNVTVSKIVVYSGLEATPDEKERGIIYVRDGALRHQEAVDKEIEDAKFRTGLDDGAGVVSITVIPGDELGQFSVNVQFEGRRTGQQREYDFCLEQQGALLIDASKCLGELLRELGVDFEVEIEAKPCPHTNLRLPLQQAANLLGFRVATSADALVQRTARHEIEVGQTSEPD